MKTTTDKMIWCYMGFGHWEQYPDGHPQVIRHQTAMAGMLPMWRERREQELKKFLEKRTRMLAERETLDWHMVALKTPIVDLYKVLSPYRS